MLLLLLLELELELNMSSTTHARSILNRLVEQPATPTATAKARAGRLTSAVKLFS